jgi:hypothetical protein
MHEFSGKTPGIKRHHFDQKRWYLKTKIGNSKKFFIPSQTSTYGENGVYNFVDFRIKRAGTSNSRGVVF